MSNQYEDEKELTGVVGLFMKVKNGIKLKKLFLKGKVRTWLKSKKK